MAMNCFVVPRTILGFTGETVIAFKKAGVTVSVAWLDVMLRNSAVMVVVPSLTAVANPLEPAVLLIVATPGVDVDHVAYVVRTCWTESANVPVAVNCLVVPLAMLVPVGASAIDARRDDLKAAEPVRPS